MKIASHGGRSRAALADDQLEAGVVGGEKAGARDHLAALVLQGRPVGQRDVDADIAVEREDVVEQHARGAPVATADLDHGPRIDAAEQLDDDLHLAADQIAAVHADPIDRSVSGHRAARARSPNRRALLAGKA